MVLRSRPPSLMLRPRLPRPPHRRRRRRRHGDARVRRKRGGLTACFRTPSWSRDHEQPCSDDGTQPSHVAPADARDELFHIRLSAGPRRTRPRFNDRLAALTDDVARDVLRDLRSARRRHYLRQLDWVDALYKAYLTAIVAGVATLVVSGALGDARAAPHTVDSIAARGPAVLGLLVAVLVAAGLRTGVRGGPLALQPPDVHQVLLAPVRRGLALRAPALSQLRGRVFTSAVAGAVVGNLAFRRLPGRPAGWIACGLGFGALGATAYMGAALIGSGRRLRAPLAIAVELLVIAWSVADWVLHVTTSPATMLGNLGVAPLESRSAALLMAGGAATALLLLGLGIAGVGGTSLEQSLRRAGLVAQLRFAVTVQDLRAVILLRRQLAGELPRSRPWFDLPLRSSLGTLGATGWRRAWRSFLRWPATRASRVAVLCALARASRRGAWPRARGGGPGGGGGARRPSSSWPAARCSSPRSTLSSRWRRRSTIRRGVR